MQVRAKKGRCSDESETIGKRGERRAGNCDEQRRVGGAQSLLSLAFYATEGNERILGMTERNCARQRRREGAYRWVVVFAGEVVPQPSHSGRDKGTLHVGVLRTLADHTLEGMQHWNA